MFLLIILVEAAGIEPATSPNISFINQLVIVLKSGFLWVFDYHFINPSILSQKILREKITIFYG
tara:strand:+ start:225 stop:416 length:192 start_codon:yes stop_codon:yes gene_type:complete